MIEIVGLLHKGNNDQIPFAYELYAASGENDRRSRQLPTPPSPRSGDRDSEDVEETPSPRGRVMRAAIHAISRILPHKDEELELSEFPMPKTATKPSADNGRVSGPAALQEQFKSTFSRAVHVHFVGAWDTVSSVGFIRDKTLPATTDGMKSVCYFRHALALHEYRVKFLPEYANGARGADPETPRAGLEEPHTKEVWFTGSHSDIGGGSTANTTLDKFGPALRWMSWEATLAGLRLDNNPPRWEKIGVSTSMTAIWRIVEFLPIKHLSYKDPSDERGWIRAWRNGPSGGSADGHRKQPVSRRPHLCANRRIAPGQRIHQSVYSECRNFKQPELVEQELDAYIEATDILRPEEEVLRSGRVFDERNSRRLELLASSVHGIRSLEESDILKYIYDIAQACRDSDGEAQILRDLWLLHLAYVKGRWRVDKGIYSHQALGLSETPSSGTFAFHMCDHLRLVSSVAFLSNTRVASGSWDQTVRIWDVISGQMSLDSPLNGHHGGINCVAACAVEGLVASASADSTIHLWTSSNDGEIRGGKVLQDESRSPVYAVAFSPDGSRLASGSWDSAIRVWDATTGERIGAPAHGHTGVVLSLSFSSDGTRLVSGSDDGTVRLWEWSPIEEALQAHVEPLKGHANRVYSVAFSPGMGTIASGSSDRTICMWDATTRSLKGTLQGHTDEVCSVAFASSGTHLVSGSDDWTVRVWDTHTRTAIRVLRGHTGSVRSVAFSPDGRRIATSSADKTVRVWDLSPDVSDTSLFDCDQQDS